MYTKVIYVLVDSLAIIAILLTYGALRKLSTEYARLLRHALIFGAFAIFTNILIAVAPNPSFANHSYSFYFASIDWILLYLTGFCLSYTDHEKSLRVLRIPALIIMIADSVAILLNPLFGHCFSIYEKIHSDAIFYQTTFKPLYYVHLGIDYIAVLITMFFIIYRISKSYDLYRQKYVMILAVLLLVVILNLLYMTLSLVLDASVIFYAVAGTLIYFCIVRFVPKKLMTDSISMVADDMKEGLVLFDLKEECIFANDFFKRRFGLNESTISFSSEPMCSVIRSLKDKGEEFGKTTYLNMRESEKGIEEEHYQIRYNQLKDKKGRGIGTYLLVEDDTEEMSYLKQIRAARDEANEANRAKSIFLANMSHEIRTPLNAVLGMNEMILRESKDPQLISYARNIRTSGNSLLHLINDILDFSRIEARKMDILPSQYNPHDLLRECYDNFEKSAAGKGLSFKIECNTNIPKSLTGDYRHILQILSNLVSNAVKYTKTGSVIISMGILEASARDRKRVTLMLTVTDTGIGIAREDIPQLFNSFQRVNEKENATIQGTGLGLAIAKELVELMGGSIRVDSILGKGSRFTISVPQLVADPTPIGEFRKDILEEEKAYHESFRAPDAHVLVVDDVDVNIVVICELLKKTEIQVDTASSGDEAIAMCTVRKYDLILLDHRMPNKDGIETFHEIRQDGQNTDTPVIMLTANALSGAAEEYQKEGFIDYLTKPIDSKALEQSLAKYLPKEKVLREK
ncbi:MAG: response regulator [Lachnospiraceae bacterium]|nr:response regulator [Lachnospiraceae bacterium]